MTVRRFIAAIAREGRLAPRDRDNAERLAAELGASHLIDHPNLCVAAIGCSSIPIGDACREGIILGRIFRKGSGGRVTIIERAEAESIVESGGNCLFDQFWGEYVAFVLRADEVEILRAPFGELAIVWAETETTIFAASDLSLLSSCGCDLRSIDWAAVARHLAEPDIRRNDTCLAAVHEIRGGSRLSIGSEGVQARSVWTPWSYQCSEGLVAPQLRETIDRCVADKVSGFERPLLLLSGGLDSSILACALAATGKSTAAINFVTEDRSGDERLYAEAVAARFGIAYYTEIRRIENVDPLRSDAAWLPRPSVRSFLQDSQTLTDRVARTTNADVVIEGSGGDNVFCSLQSVAPVADRIRSGASPRDILQSARDIAQLTDATILAILRRALYRAWFRADPYRIAVDHSFLGEIGIALSTGAARHPWLEGSARQLPGKVGHMAMLVAAQGWVECLDPLSVRPTLGPLLAQPIVEACFAVPSWEWFAGGQNRVPAREAYRGILPDLIVDRRSKATPDSFVTQLYNRHRPLLRELLLDGRLAREGLLDRAALEQVMSVDGPPVNHMHRRVMRIADVEVWLGARLQPTSRRRW